MKKIAVIVLISAVFLTLCWGVGKVIHRNDKGIDEKQSVSQDADNKSGSLQWDENDISIMNSQKTSDNPWGFTAGLIDTESDGRCVFLTPNTSLLIDFTSSEKLKEGFEINYMIHPWVAKGSDGLGIVILFKNSENEILLQEDYFVDNSDSWKKQSIRCDLDEVNSVEIMCNNGNEDNDEADWLIIR